MAVMILFRVLATMFAVAAAVLAYPAQRYFAGQAIGDSVTQMQFAHVSMLLTASLLTWPGSTWGAQPGVFYSLASVSSLVCMALLPFGMYVSPPQTFLLVVVLGAFAARAAGRRP